MKINPRYVTVALVIWAVLQTPRLIALPLIKSAATGVDQAIWLIPALGDIANVILVPFVIWALLKSNRTVTGWLLIVVWLVMSIYDHVTAVTSFTMAGVPTIFENFGENGAVAPTIQTIFDIAFIWLVTRKPVRATFFKNEHQ